MDTCVMVKMTLGNTTIDKECSSLILLEADILSSSLAELPGIIIPQDDCLELTEEQNQKFVESSIKTLEADKKLFPAYADQIDEEIAKFKKYKNTFEFTLYTCSTDGCNQKFPDQDNAGTINHPNLLQAVIYFLMLKF